MNASSLCSPKQISNPNNHHNFKTATLNPIFSDDDSINGNDRKISPQPFHLKSVQDRYI